MYEKCEVYFSSSDEIYSPGVQTLFIPSLFASGSAGQNRTFSALSGQYIFFLISTGTDFRFEEGRKEGRQVRPIPSPRAKTVSETFKYIFEPLFSPVSLNHSHLAEQFCVLSLLAGDNDRRWPHFQFLPREENYYLDRRRRRRRGKKLLLVSLLVRGKNRWLTPLDSRKKTFIHRRKVFVSFTALTQSSEKRKYIIMYVVHNLCVSHLWST